RTPPPANGSTMAGTLSALLEPEAHGGLVLEVIAEATAGMGESVLYEGYRADPVGFGEEVLGEAFTDDIEAVMESVRDNPVTIALSANATGKTHGAARVAAWFYKCFPGAQVYTAAAPPEKNLKKLLWGEIDDVVSSHPDV